MKVISDKKLDFSDVLILPKRSTLSSRSDAVITRKFIFKNNLTLEGTPVVCANMDTIGNFEIAKVLFEKKMFSMLHKHYSIKDLQHFFNSDNNLQDFVGISFGTSLGDVQKLRDCVDKIDFKIICIDVANGYSQNFINIVSEIRVMYPNHILVAGNVCTPDIVQELILKGVDIVKIGIGSGCFTRDTRVLMGTGIYKNINEIKIGDYVINKNGDAVKVLNVINQGLKKVIKTKMNNWHEDVFVTGDHQYFIGDLTSSSDLSKSGVAKLLDKKEKSKPKKSKYKWKSIDDITKKMTLLMPNNIKWKLQDDFVIDLTDFNIKGKFDENIITTNGSNTFTRYLHSNYELGYIFGTFLGDGHSKLDIYKNSERGSCHWDFGLHEIDIANKLYNCIKKFLGYECSIKEKKENMLHVSCYNKCLAKVLYEFNKRTEKNLPEKYYCNNKEYIRGLFDGLIDSDGHIDINKSGSINITLSNTSKPIIELYYWCCMNLGYSFCSVKRKKTIGNLVGTCIENLQQSYNIKTHTLNRFTKDYVYSILQKKEECIGLHETWDIEVDCPTHSFIANNSIVHNSACTTRKIAGVGYPQLSCIMECSEVAHALNGYIMSDGGCTLPCDIGKALGAGSDFVMIGGMLAGTDLSSGEIIEEDGKQYKKFYGMSSSTAMNKYNGGVAKYRAPEGKTIKIPYKGSILTILQDILGGIRSCMTYIGAKKIKDVSKCTTFILVNSQYNKVFNKYEE